MFKEIENIKEEATNLLHSDLQKGIGFLDNLTLKLTDKPHLQDAVLFLNMDFSDAKGPAELEAVKGEAFEFLEKLITVLEENELKEIQFSEEEKKPKADLTMVDNPVVLNIKNLGKKYPGGFELRGVEAVFRLGEITGVVGENANGKTTLFNILAGIKAHDSGKIEFPLFESMNVREWQNLKSRIAYVPQELPERFGSLKNLLHLSCSKHGIFGEENQREVEFIIHRLGLYEHINKSWPQLSGGFKLRFALAEALVWKPKLLILDEPLANLDINAQLLVLTDILNLAKSLKNPISVIISSQHLLEVESIADRLVFLDKGRMVFNGKVEDVGVGRKENIYEFSTEVAVEDLKSKLKSIQHNSLEFNGLNYILSTPLSVENEQMFDWFMSEKIDVGYFRNISHSIKKFFV